MATAPVDRYSPVLSIRMEPKPTGLIVLHHHGDTVITLEWSDGDQHRCRRCPAGRCGATPHGTCTRVAPGELSAAEALAFRIPG
jgi:hypothetical protein